MAIPYIDRQIFLALVPYLPSVIIVLLIEHIAIAKSFGTINNYVIDPNQELIAISQASLPAVIIHAVCDLIVGPRTLKQFWQVSPVEFLIFCIGVIVTIFSNIENGIYVSMLASCTLLLSRIAKAQGQFLGRIKIHQIQLISDNNIYSTNDNIDIPFNHSDGTNPMINPILPGNGIFIYRMYESFLFPNATYYMEKMISQIFREIKAGKTIPYNNLGEQPWNLKTSRHPEKEQHPNDNRPRLHAIILDFTGVSYIDITTIQNLVDVRQQLDNYANWKVNWHFVGLSNSWIKRALISRGFGSSDNARTVFSVVNIHNHDDDNNITNIVQFEDYTSTNLLSNTNTMLVPILDIDRPLFHIDIDEAYTAAVASLSIRQ
ncbi:unnamed protein product [Rotaria sp. Silwood2]|nr:unnamed protein product [Rotaria sp. Silwood2]